MFTGYLGFAGNELVNSARAWGYTRTLDCPIDWLRLKDDSFAGWEAALGGRPYEADEITDAPWYDPDVPASARFYGLFSMGISGLRGSTRTGSSVEGLMDGGSIRAGRRAVRQVRARAMMVAHGEDALEVGLSWLEARLDARTCALHDGTCGEGDIDFFASQPKPQQVSETGEQYQRRIRGLRRHVRQAKAISGPLVLASHRRGDVYAYEVEFTLAAGTPHIYSEPIEVAVPPTVPAIISDVPYNLVPYPSAQLAAGELVTSRNLVTNPSVEIDAAGWSAAVGSVISGTSPAAFLTSGRDTSIAAEGGASYRARILGTGSTVAASRARIETSIGVSVAGLADRSRLSFSIWAGVFILGGASTSVINGVSVVAEWRQGTTPVLVTTVGNALSTQYGGRVFSLRQQAIPAGADNVRLVVRYDVTWASSSSAANNSDIQMFADAAAITIP